MAFDIRLHSGVNITTSRTIYWRQDTISPKIDKKFDGIIQAEREKTLIDNKAHADSEEGRNKTKKKRGIAPLQNPITRNNYLALALNSSRRFLDHAASLEPLTAGYSSP